jgi:hypothetical protein
MTERGDLSETVQHMMGGEPTVSFFHPGDRHLGDVTRVVRHARPQRKADLYESLGLALMYEPDDRRMRVEADLSRGNKVRGGAASNHMYRSLSYMSSTSPLEREVISLSRPTGNVQILVAVGWVLANSLFCFQGTSEIAALSEP